jgi:tetratricopeptide (TPR) repeat protein
LQQSDLAKDRLQWDTVEVKLKQAGAILGEVQSLRLDMEASYQRGLYAQALGNPEEAGKLFMQALDIARHSELRGYEGLCLSALGACSAARGDLEVAEEQLRIGLDTLVEIDHQSDQPTVLISLGQFLIEKRGQFEDGCLKLREAEHLLDQMDIPNVAVQQLLQRYGCM